jgi:hypothetical protein
MVINDNEFIELLKFQIKRSVTNLYKNYLHISQDLVDEGYINNDKYQIIRKKTLDNGNDVIRELEELLDKVGKLTNNN